MPPKKISHSNNERPPLPELERLKAIRDELTLADDPDRSWDELYAIVEWVITEIENRRFRYRRQYIKQRMLAQVTKERLAADELRLIDQAASELAAKLIEKEEDDIQPAGSQE